MSGRAMRSILVDRAKRLAGPRATATLRCLLRGADLPRDFIAFRLRVLEPHLYGAQIAIACKQVVGERLRVHHATARETRDELRGILPDGPNVVHVPPRAAPGRQTGNGMADSTGKAETLRRRARGTRGVFLGTLALDQADAPD